MNRIIENIRSISGVIASLLLVTMFGSFLLQIFFRYIMGWSVGWTIEYDYIAWLWIILCGYGFVVREYVVINLDILYAYLPEKTKRVFDFFTNLICGMILILSLPKSIDYIEFMSIERTAYLRINFALLFSIYVPFAVVVSFRCLLNAWNALKGKGYETEFEV